MKIPVERWQVKFFLPTLGLVAAYVATLWGFFFLSMRTPPPSMLTNLLILGLLGLTAGFGAMLGLRSLIGENAGHVDLIKIPQYWLATGFSLYAADWIFEKAVGWEFSPLLCHAVLLGSGIFAAWTDEPGFAWPRLPRSGKP